MTHEISAGLIIFFQAKEKEYLFLHYPKGHWDFPKGHLEKGETALDAAKREAQEETGISNLSVIRGFEEKISYFFRAENKTIFKEVTFFLAESKTREVRISKEHKGFVWLSYTDALQKLTFKSSKDILQKAHDTLEK